MTTGNNEIKNKQKQSSRPGKRLKLVIPIIAVLIVVGVFIGVGNLTSDPVEGEEMQADEENELPTVDVAEVIKRDIEETATVTGNVEPNDERMVIPQVGGEIETIYVEEGDEVSQGETLMEIDSEEASLQRQEAQSMLDAAVANLEEAEAGARDAETVEAETAVDNARENKEQAERELNRIEEMHEQEFATDQQLEQAEMQYENAESQLESAEAAKDAVEDGARQEQIDALEAQVRQAEIGVELARRAEGNSVVDAPTSGTVVMAEYDEGELAGTGEPAFIIMDQETMQVKASVPASYINEVELGDQVEIDVPAVGDDIYQGEIQKIGDLPGEGSRNYPVEIVLAEKQSEIKTGMHSEANISIGLQEDVPVIPREALVEQNDEMGIYTIQEQEEQYLIEFLTLELGSSQDGMIHVEDGLSADEEIVVNGQTEVNPGDEVEINHIDLDEENSGGDS